MYLDDAALRRTLEVVARRSAPGSTLVAHYHEPESTPQHRKPRWLFFLWLGEPQIGLRSRETMAGEIARVGLRIDEDTGIAEQAARVGGTQPTHPSALVSRILVATVGS